MKILGIDEAGRGCVIGPMAVGAVVFEGSDLEYLEGLGVKDSKLLPPEKRENLYPRIRERATFHEIKLVSPADIDEVSLNQIDLREIISFITKFDPDKVIFDVPTNPAGVANFVKAVRLGLANTGNSDVYVAPQRGRGLKSATISTLASFSSRPGQRERALKGATSREERTFFSAGPVLVGENKADEKYPIVSAASILAKVERDQVISDLHKEYGDFGSGYMGDTRTQEFLRKWFAEHGDFPPIVRRKWSSVRKFLENQQEMF